MTPREQELYDLAQRALPSWYSPIGATNEQLYSKAKILAQANVIDEEWLSRQSRILQSDGPTATTPDWLGQHAIDRGTSRQNGESDAVLRARISSVEESLTIESLIAEAQAILAASGASGTVYALELPRDEAYLSTNVAATGTGGTFATQPGGFSFEPSAATKWLGRPPYRAAGVMPVIDYKLTVSGAANAVNNGTFATIGLVGDAVVFVNAPGVPGIDATASWRVDRFGVDGASITVGAGCADAYLDRGFRMGGVISTVIFILPFGTTEATRLAVEESIRQKKAAGVVVVVERREVP